jgi:hypothetical protein
VFLAGVPVRNTLIPELVQRLRAASLHHCGGGRSSFPPEARIRVVADAACEAARYQWSMTKRRILVAVSMLLFALAGATIVFSGRSEGVRVDPHGTALPAQREVQVSLLMPSPSSSDGLHAKLVGGTMPSAAVQATVLTDEQCQPDTRGLSHCLNRMRLPDGSELELRHPHDMSAVPCLAPGEKVRLVPSFDS